MAEPTRKAPPQTKTAEKKPPPRVDIVRHLVCRQMVPSIRMLVGAKRANDIERFAKVFVNAIEFGHADLMLCTDASLARAMMHSAEVNLEVGGAYPHAYLIPYKNHGRLEAQFQISVWGYLELIRRSGTVRKVWADVVFEHDVFKAISGTAGKQIVHEPNWFAPRASRGKVLGSYACALLENGETVFEPVSFEELQLAREQNRGKSPAWDQWPEQQYQKVALKRLQKYLAKGTIPERALDIDEDPGTRPIIDVAGVDSTPDEQPTPEAQGPLDQAVAQQRAAQAANPANEQATIDRDKLFATLCDCDERYLKHRAKVDGWDEIEALSVLAFLRVIMSGDFGDNDVPPEMPACMRLEREVA